MKAAENRTEKAHGLLRVCAIFSAAAALLAFTGCGKKEASAPAPSGAEAAFTCAPTEAAEPAPARSEEAFYVVDAAPAYAHVGIEQVFETDTTVYYLLDDLVSPRIYCSDKQNTDWMPLCSRPDCLHHDPSCNSYLEGPAYCKMWLYGDHIYYCVLIGNSPVLRRMALDGSEHEMLYDLGRLSLNSLGCSWFFHNKYLIVTFVCFISYPDDTGTVDFSSPESFKTTRYIIDLSDPKAEPRRLEFCDENGTEVPMGSCLIGKGDMLYWINEDDNNALIAADIVSANVRKLCELPFVPESYGLWINGGKLIMSTCGDTCAIVGVDLNTGDIEKLNEAEPYTTHWADPFGEYIFGNDYRDGRMYGLEIYSTNGEHIARVEYPENVQIAYCHFFGNFVFGYDYETEKEYTLNLPSWYIDINEIGADALAWHRWEP